MTITSSDLRTLHQVIDRLSPEQLEELQAFLSTIQAPEPLPIYRIYEHAVDAEVDDLAENHDHYLYSRKPDTFHSSGRS
jgi:hypothetical protein